jgi:hypothetical protein
VWRVNYWQKSTMAHGTVRSAEQRMIAKLSEPIWSILQMEWPSMFLYCDENLYRKHMKIAIGM